MHLARPIAAAALAACTLAVPCARATVLYKSISPEGVIQFSDTPPENAAVVEERWVDGSGSGGAPIFGMPGGAMLAFENPLQAAAGGLVLDDALARANAQVDLAEHQLALARRSTWTHREGLRLAAPRRTRADGERIAFYERNLKAARAHLLEVMGTDPVFSLAEQDALPRRVLARR